MLNKWAINKLSALDYNHEPLSDEWVLITTDEKDDELEIGHVPCMNDKKSNRFWKALTWSRCLKCGVCGTSLPDSYKMILHLKEM